MVFVYRYWKDFCRKLSEAGIKSVPLCEVVSPDKKRFFSLKHDVETNPSKALVLAEIEHEYGHRSTFYVQAYLLENPANIGILRQIADLGHEVSYHLDAVDQSAGDMVKADAEFLRCRALFEKNGFVLKTVCQHGNALMQRDGYNGNRDFFRDPVLAAKYSDITEIMVNFRNRCSDPDYLYISDAGYGWKIISNPENNDLKTCTAKDVPVGTLDNVLEYAKKGSLIVSTHPHRWRRSWFYAVVRDGVFKVVRKIAKCIYRIPFFRKFMQKHYRLAKKI